MFVAVASRRGSREVAAVERPRGPPYDLGRFQSAGRFGVFVDAEGTESFLVVGRVIDLGPGLAA
jgi:hypothetical protein